MDKNPADITDAAYINDVNLTPASTPVKARAEDEPQSTVPDDKTPAKPSVDREGKLVFSPSELNQAGEDKEYFHPDKGHKFDAPKDANDHALTPDVEVTPDNDIKRI